MLSLPSSGHVMIETEAWDFGHHKFSQGTERKRSSPPGQPSELLHKLIPSPNSIVRPRAPLSELSLFNYFSLLFLISSHHWKYQWWWEWRGEKRRGVNALLIALMWIRCEHRAPPPPPPHPPITFQLITVSRASPQDTLARWLACQSELLGSICNLSPVSSFFLSFHNRSPLFSISQSFFSLALSLSLSLSLSLCLSLSPPLLLPPLICLFTQVLFFFLNLYPQKKKKSCHISSIYSFFPW